LAGKIVKSEKTASRSASSSKTKAAAPRAEKPVPVSPVEAVAPVHEVKTKAKPAPKTDKAKAVKAPAKPRKTAAKAKPAHGIALVTRETTEADVILAEVAVAVDEVAAPVAEAVSEVQATPTEPKPETAPEPAPAHDAAFYREMEAAIRWRAYELYLQRGGRHGSADQDWVTAEREIRARFMQRTA
jgi:hypothetical protein